MHPVTGTRLVGSGTSCLGSDTAAEGFAAAPSAGTADASVPQDSKCGCV